MIRIHGRAVTYGECWFDETVPADPDVDIVKVRLRPSPLHGYPCTEFRTLISDLTCSEPALFAGFGGTNRYKIKRAESRDGLAYRFSAGPEDQLDAFCDFYDTFARQKAIFGSYRRGLWAACSAGQLALSSATYDGATLVWHAYMTDGKTASLLHTASHFRSEDTERRALIARANRWLHWRDMLSLKALGCERLCWGGMFEDETEPEHANINNFKREFAGREERSYECTIPVTLKGRLFIPALQLFDAIETRRARASREQVQDRAKRA